MSATTAVGTEWLQITVGAKPRNVYGVVTKGNAGPGFANAYVSAFTVKSYNPMFAGRHDPHNPVSAFVDVDGGRIFRGNSDAKTAVRTAFRRPTFAQDIRVYPHEASALQTYKWDAPLTQRSNPPPFVDDGNGPYDDESPMRRFTVEVILTNNSNRFIPDHWSPVFISAAGRPLPTCIWYYNNTVVQPDEMINVTFDTHTEADDWVSALMFDEIGYTLTLCLSPSGQVVSCQ